MRWIPVLDLMDGEVVHAIAGARARYRPIRSALVASSSPAIVARALLRAAHADALYIADLDAITQGGSARHRAVLEALCPVLADAGARELWLDAGPAHWVADVGTCARAAGLQLVRVIGSESLDAADALHDWSAETDCALSLDARQGAPLGPAGLDARPAHWPSRVIAMELSAVGTGQGPALDRIAGLAAAARRAGRCDVGIYAAGGVRDMTDIEQLERAGAVGVLLASALHNGSLARAA